MGARWRLLIVSCLASLASGAGCAGPCPAPPPQLPGPSMNASQASATSPEAPAAVPPSERKVVAVLPIEDDRLFRSERATLRETLARALEERLPAHSMLPLPTVDAQLAPVTKTGTRCAYEHAPRARRAWREGWRTTELIQIAGAKGNEKLWVEVSNEGGQELVLEGLWNPELDRLERYRAAFAAMAVLPDGGGGLLSGTLREDEGVTVGSLALCERTPFGACAAGTEAFRDQAQALTKCFAGSAEGAYELLFEPRGSCEIAGLDAPNAAESLAEACLCSALRSSAGAPAKAERRLISVRFEAPDLARKPRPELRVLESSGNLDAREDWHRFELQKADKTSYSSVLRLSVDNLDAQRAALARCSTKPASTILAELSVSPAGATSSVRLLPGGPATAFSRCVVAALQHGAFSCTTDGNAAKLRVAITWPE